MTNMMDAVARLHKYDEQVSQLRRLQARTIEALFEYGAMLAQLDIDTGVILDDEEYRAHVAYLERMSEELREFTHGLATSKQIALADILE